jgi:hypothetical protein
MGKLAEIERRDIGDTTPPRPPTVADNLERDGLVSRDVVEGLAERVAELEDWRDARAPHGQEGDGAPYGHGDAREGDQRSDTLTGWRAVCVAVLVRLKLLLDAIIRTLRGERG